MAGIAYLVNAPRPNAAATRLQVTASAAYLGGTDAPSGLRGAPTTTIRPPLDQRISLSDLADEARAASAADPRPRLSIPSTTAVRGAAVTTSTTARSGTSTTSTTSKGLAPTTVAPGPLTPLTTILQQVVPAAATYTHAETGVASWFGAPTGTCAHRTLPMGTVLKVTRLYNGATVACKVNDRGPSDTSRLLDLSKDTFEKLASIDAGLIDVKIEW